MCHAVPVALVANMFETSLRILDVPCAQSVSAFDSMDTNEAERQVRIRSQCFLTTKIVRLHSDDSDSLGTRPVRIWNIEESETGQHRFMTILHF